MCCVFEKLIVAEMDTGTQSAYWYARKTDRSADAVLFHNGTYLKNMLGILEFNVIKSYILMCWHGQIWHHKKYEFLVDVVFVTICKANILKPI